MAKCVSEGAKIKKKYKKRIFKKMPKMADNASNNLSLCFVMFIGGSWDSPLIVLRPI